MSPRSTRREFLTSATVAAAAAAGVTVPLIPALAGAQPAAGPDAPLLTARERESMDDDLLDATIARLAALYEDHKYSASEVTRWYLDRIARYDPVYRAVLHVDGAAALRAAAALDADVARQGKRFNRGPLTGVPIVTKANTSVKGLVTSAGWYGYLVPGLELVAPMDATVVGKLRAAGAIIIGQTNMPDFAASDTNFSTAFGRTGNAYNVRFSPGGSSGGTVTAVTANFCLLGNGTDTGNSIRMPAGTSSVVGVLPTRGLVSIAGIHPLDWLLDDTGPIARTVTDAAIALDVMRGEDPRDFRTAGSATRAQAGPYTSFLNPRALAGKRFGVPAFIVDPSEDAAARGGGLTIHPDTRRCFTAALDGLRAAGATVVIDATILPPDFLALAHMVNTQPYASQGPTEFLRDYGPAAWHSPQEYAFAVGTQMPDLVRGVNRAGASARSRIQDDPGAEANVWGPQRRAVAAYDETLDRLHLDGYVYPSAQMPPNDEMIPLANGGRSQGPHSNTSWVNPLGVPAVVVPGGFYDNGLPFGLELATKRWHDGDLLGWAFAYEQATRHRKPPVLTDRRPT